MHWRTFISYIHKGGIEWIYSLVNHMNVLPRATAVYATFQREYKNKTDNEFLLTNASLEL